MEQQLGEVVGRAELRYGAARGLGGHDRLCHGRALAGYGRDGGPRHGGVGRDGGPRHGGARGRAR
ncbi:hypothetical protein K3A88_29850, partial [Streptomyces geysiriensis]|nr:hypothetical protein [Streptomyces geysiriensis]